MKLYNLKFVQILDLAQKEQVEHYSTVRIPVKLCDYGKKVTILIAN